MRFYQQGTMLSGNKALVVNCAHVGASATEEDSHMPTRSMLTGVEGTHI
jgi:hypothetical protein